MIIAHLQRRKEPMSEVAWIPIPRTAQISADYIAELIRAPALRNEECSGCRHLDGMKHYEVVVS